MTVKPTDGPAIGADAFAEAHRRLLANDSIQFDLQPIDPPPAAPNWSGGWFDFLNSPITNGVFWVIVGLAALAIIYFIALRLSGFEPPWRRSRSLDEIESVRPAQGLARQLLDEADALAEQGRFSEAAHLLLFRSIEDIDSRRPDLLRPALTSRDIAALPAIPDQPRGAFARIAMLVERSLFAMRPLVEGDWRECRAAYEQFAFAEAWHR